MIILVLYLYCTARSDTEDKLQSDAAINICSILALRFVSTRDLSRCVNLIVIGLVVVAQFDFTDVFSVGLSQSFLSTFGLKSIIFLQHFTLGIYSRPTSLSKAQ